jgi:hypothetical protein
VTEPRFASDDQKQPPLRARLHRYKLTVGEFSLLTAMCEHCSDGSVIKASIPRLAAYAKLSEKQVDRLIDGYEDPRTKARVPGFKERGILTELSPYNAGRRMPAIYRLNEDALQLDPRMRKWLNKQAQRLLPGILKAPKVVPPAPPVSDVRPEDFHNSPHGVGSTPPTVSGGLPPRCPETPPTVSSNSRAFDSTALHSSSVGIPTERLQLWMERNSYVFKDYRQELRRISQACIGSNDNNFRDQVLAAAYRTGVPEHIALAIEELD